jgi:hypothetical protein
MSSTEGWDRVGVAEKAEGATAEVAVEAADGLSLVLVWCVRLGGDIELGLEVCGELAEGKDVDRAVELTVAAVQAVAAAVAQLTGIGGRPAIRASCTSDWKR